MLTIKQQRTAEQIKVTLSELFLREMGDPRLQALTVTDARIDRELQYADIYVYALGDESREEPVMEALEKATGFLRRALGQRLRLRTVPVLHFHWDPSVEQAAQIHDLLDSLDIPPEEEE